ncbi:hypothetical protein ACFVXQ_24905 [Kitasatospora sp. NPDC058263]
MDEQLFTGAPGETTVEREARLDAAHAVLADLHREDPGAGRLRHRAHEDGAGAAAAAGRHPP